PPSEFDAVQAARTQAAERVGAQEVRVRIRTLAIALARLNREVLEARLNDYDWERQAYQEQIDAVNASLRSLREDLKRTQIHAPISGVLLKLERESEQTVAAGTPILELGDLEQLEVEADFLSEDVVRMRQGMDAEIFGRALGDAVLPAKVTRIHPSAFEKISSLGVEQQRVKVLLSLDTGSVRLGDLYRVEVRVILDERDDVLLVPEGALFRHEGTWHAFVLDAGRARLQAVRTGLRDGRDREVLGGLTAGDRVILYPDDSLEDGIRVEALPE
ncbi:MAG: efflux RND transporter periplasmic adaptor subunit, partial [Planctomycetota bacterium]